MKRLFLALFALAAAAHLVASPKPAEAASPRKDIESLYPARSAVCWYDADILDDLALNARGKITFIYVDAKLGRALGRLREEQRKSGATTDIPQNVFAYAAKYNTRKHQALFAARVQAPKLWEFDSSKLSVGGYSPNEKDIITGGSSNPSIELKSGVRELQKGYNGFIGFFVPDTALTPGTEIQLGYDGYMVDWKVPAKNE